jgi:YidC/Oxa1 family membrane protein insertase
MLPIIMGATNFIQMRIMQTPSTDELQAQIQKQMMVMMPIMFTFFLYQLPSGLVLYWIVSNTISIGQSYLTKRIIASHMAAHEQAKLKLATS